MNQSGQWCYLFWKILLWTFLFIEVSGRTPMITVWEITAGGNQTLILPLEYGKRPYYPRPFEDLSDTSRFSNIVYDGIGQPILVDIKFKYDFEVDWGDGTTSRVKSLEDFESWQHTYEHPGIYTVTITGIMEAWNNLSAGGLGIVYGSRNAELLRVEDMGDMGWKSLHAAFAFFRKLTTVSVSDGHYLSEVYDMRATFEESPLVRPETGNWVTSNVRDMGRTFFKATSANPDVSDWDVTWVTDTGAMFYMAVSAEPDVSCWNTVSLVMANNMFFGAKKASPDITHWPTFFLEHKEQMFHGSAWNPTIRTGKCS